MSSRIAQLNVNPQIVWRTLGPNQYSERPLYAITIRELIQNADDAILASGRRDGFIYLELEQNEEFIKLRCKDNGIGMTEDIILDKFLCLGESEKSDGSTGGFGIAKAAIIGACDRWSIKTQDNYLDSDMIGKEAVKKVEYSEGTEIILEWNKESNKDLLPTVGSHERAMQFMAYSELKSGAKIKYIRKNIEISLDIEYDKKIIDDNKDYTITLCEIKNKPDWFEPNIIYRLNGLVQFFKSFSHEGDLFFIIDIKTDKKPQDSNYPLGPSRETIKYQIEQNIKKITEPYRINNISGKRAFNEKMNEVMYYPGKTIGQGKNESLGYFYSSIPSKFSSEMLKQGEENPQDYEFIVRRVNSNAKINIHAENNIKLLYVWAQLLELGAKSVGIDKKETFGIGFILDDNTKAERYSYNDKVFYLINPKVVPISKPQECIPKLIFLAAHELSHSLESNHNEYFTIQECDIFFKMYESFGEIKHLRKFMREGIF